MVDAAAQRKLRDQWQKTAATSTPGSHPSGEEQLEWHVILPQLRPTTFMAIVVTVIGALRSFDLISVMTGGGPFESSTVLAYYMYDQAIKYYRIGYSASVAVVLFAIMLVYIVYHLRRMLSAEQ